MAPQKKISEYGASYSSVSFHCELSVFSFEEAMLGNLEDIKSQDFPSPSALLYHDIMMTVLKNVFVATALPCKTKMSKGFVELK